MKKKLIARNLSILIVDDVKSMRSIVRSMLKNMKIGKTLHMAENGLEALKVLHTCHVDLVITDWRMPVMNGTRLLEAIRSDRRLRDLPVLMVTAESEKEIVLDAAEIEVEGYLLKPLTPSVLEKKIQTIIDQVNQPDKATLHLRKARRLEENMDIETAIKHMQCAVQLKPGASRLLRNLGLLYQKSGDSTAMETYLKKAAAVNPQDVVTRRILGNFYWKTNNLLSAVCYYQQVVNMTRKFCEEAVDLGGDLLKEGQSHNAKLLFSTIIAKSPKNQPLLEKIVDTCMEHEEHRYALGLLKRLIRDYPSNMDLVYQAGTVCEMMDDNETAIANFLLVDKHQFSRIDVKLKLARLFILKKKVIQADNYLNQVLKKDPSNEEALTLRRLV